MPGLSDGYGRTQSSARMYLYRADGMSYLDEAFHPFVI
jgi:hypothetical protein